MIAAATRTPPQDRPSVAELAEGGRARFGQQVVEGSYDAATIGGALESHWDKADALDADSANNRDVRRRLVQRMRLEYGNNGYVAGIIRTYANSLVGKTGPSLRMLTRNHTFNQVVETLFWNYLVAIRFRQKLWTLAHAKALDGESIAIIGTNPRVRNRVKIDLRLIETEQCTTPNLPYGTERQIDGMTLDAWGNPETYQILPHHPGANNQFVWGQEPIDYRAANVLHWYDQIRPGQHRGIPSLSPSLNVGAHSRRAREATVKALERAASMSVVMKTQQLPDARPAEENRPFTQMPIVHDAFVSFPEGWDPEQLRSEHPSSQYAPFMQQQLSETARPIGQPYNVAAADSRDSSFSSGKLDHLGWWAFLDIGREDCNEIALDPLFAHWWNFAVLIYGFDADPDAPPAHGWNWPQHPIIDVGAEAEAQDKNLKNGTLGIDQAYTRAGQDYEDELVKRAESHGITVDEMRRIDLLTNLPMAKEVLAPLATTPAPAPIEPEEVNNAQAA